MPDCKRCGLCEFYEKGPDPEVETMWGECRRHPPQVVWDPHADNTLTVFPTVGKDDLCGEFRAAKIPTLQDLADRRSG